MVKRHFVIVPGNGEGCAGSNFYPWLASELRSRGHTVSLSEMPEANAAPSGLWQRFILEESGADAASVLIGHSSGACAVLRLAEKGCFHGVVAVSMTDNDLGDAGERASGWYDAPWKWGTMRGHVKHLVVFASDDDPFIPIATQRRVGDFLEKAEAEADADAANDSNAPTKGTFEYIELTKRSHFFAKKQLEILQSVLRVAEAE